MNPLSKHRISKHRIRLKEYWEERLRDLDGDYPTPLFLEIPPDSPLRDLAVEDQQLMAQKAVFAARALNALHWRSTPAGHEFYCFVHDYLIDLAEQLIALAEANDHVFIREHRVKVSPEGLKIGCTHISPFTAHKVAKKILAFFEEPPSSASPEECPGCGSKLEYDPGQHATLDEPGQPPSWYCKDCGFEDYGTIDSPPPPAKWDFKAWWEKDTAIAAAATEPDDDDPEE